jgi:hypothetical protein
MKPLDNSSFLKNSYFNLKIFNFSWNNKSHEGEKVKTRIRDAFLLP